MENQKIDAERRLEVRVILTRKNPKSNLGNDEQNNYLRHRNDTKGKCLEEGETRRIWQRNVMTVPSLVFSKERIQYPSNRRSNTRQRGYKMDYSYAFGQDSQNYAYRFHSWNDFYDQKSDARLPITGLISKFQRIFTEEKPPKPAVTIFSFPRLLDGNKRPYPGETLEERRVRLEVIKFQSNLAIGTMLMEDGRTNRKNCCDRIKDFRRRVKDTWLLRPTKLIGIKVPKKFHIHVDFVAGIPPFMTPSFIRPLTPDENRMVSDPHFRDFLDRLSSGAV